MGFKLNEDDAKDQYAMLNMRERCSVLDDKMMPYKVIKDFRLTNYSWVFPWDFNKKNEPTRAVLVNRTQGIKIEQLQN